jgi:hypothetical protein
MRQIQHTFLHAFVEESVAIARIPQKSECTWKAIRNSANATERNGGLASSVTFTAKILLRPSRNEWTCLSSVMDSRIHGMESVAIVGMQRNAIRQQSECTFLSRIHGFTELMLLQSCECYRSNLLQWTHECTVHLERSRIHRMDSVAIERFERKSNLLQWHGCHRINTLVRPLSRKKSTLC